MCELADISYNVYQSFINYLCCKEGVGDLFLVVPIGRTGRWGDKSTDLERGRCNN